jgi:hypothetical protein
MRFDDWFREHFGATAPVGYCLRADHGDRWLRLHSLPGSKRYAEDDGERAEVRRRAWAAAAALFPAGSAVWLVVPSFDGAPSILDGLPRKVVAGGPFEHPLFCEPLRVDVAQITWPHGPGLFEALIDEIAIDAFAENSAPSPASRTDASRAVWFSVATGEAFAPYDGGIDLFGASEARVEASGENASRTDALRRMFPRDWFSPRADGL